MQMPNISKVEIVSCDAGWRNYHFCKLTCSNGIVGWSEFDEAFGAPGVGTIIKRLSTRIVGLSVGAIETVYSTLWLATRPAAGGVVAIAIAAIENAQLDAKAKALDVPCYELFGGKVRDSLRVYWSHCGTWRISRGEFYKPAVTDLDGVVALGREVREKGYTALKTNVYSYGPDGKAKGWGAGFGSPFYPELNADHEQVRGLRTHLEAFRSGAGSNVDILLDLNFNFKTDGIIQILRTLEDFDLLWVEYDTASADALADIRKRSRHPIASCETLLGLHQFLPFFKAQAMDVAIVDVIWNGGWQAIKIAASANAHELNVAPHNFYGHLSTMMSVHFAAAVPNLRIVEMDVDRIENDSRIFTYVPQVVDGRMLVPDTPGWGTEPNEEFIKSIPPKSAADLMNVGPRKHLF